MTSEVVRHHLFRFKMVAKPKSLRCYRDPYTLVPFSNVKVLKFALDGLVVVPKTAKCNQH